MNNWHSDFKRIFWVGLFCRLACTPFLLQWFHPDERQTLEFAHFQAHGRLHPFLESELHLRNQTAPWIVSNLIEICDALSLSTPWLYLILTHTLIGALSAWSLNELARLYNDKKLAWAFAIFWIFPWIYSRQLLEVTSLIPTCLLFIAIQKLKPIQAGISAGLIATLRYPSALWLPGGLFLLLSRVSENTKRQVIRFTCFAFVVFVLTLLVGGLADLKLYGSWMKSALAYWNFNRPGGPVQAMFGNDSLLVYYRWFEFMLTPWLAPVFLLLAVYSLIHQRTIALFILPYVIGHLWTPHREPRFMIPLVPFLFLAISQTLQDPKFGVRRVWNNKWVRGAAYAHLLLNFVWYPLNSWSQWNSAQGILIRNYSDLKNATKNTEKENEKETEKDTLLLTQADPLIDVLVPSQLSWADEKCQLHRPLNLPSLSKIIVFSKTAPSDCTAFNDHAQSRLAPVFERIFRVRTASLWTCKEETLSSICSTGLKPAPDGEPYMDQKL